ncbi:MAG: alkaline phosphatase family protein [Lewinellaceae bacterium]|nr:alkaline phosphatase family protein [Lewinellaceae bacterium]
MLITTLSLMKDFVFMKKKVLLIGWDAADWKVIHPLIDKGFMPNLGKLIGEGVMGNLMTLDPPLSPMLWTSIATGKRPYKHGVMGFVEPNPAGTNIRPIHVTPRKVKAIWNMLMQKSYKVHQVGWWPSHPAEPINGNSVSNFYQRANAPIQDPWPLLAGTIHPPEKNDIFASLRFHPDELTWEDLHPFIPNGHQINQKDKHTRNLLISLKKIIAACTTIHSATTYILEQEDWDFMAVYHDAIDHIGHGFMKYHPPLRPHVPKDLYDAFHNVVTATYRFHDTMLGSLIELAGEDATILLVSDHGFHSDHLRVNAIPKDPAGPSWEHGPYGIFVMKGPNIRKDETIYGASLLDITPTVLAHLEEPIGLDMDGKILTNVFENIPEIKTINSWEDVSGECGMHSKDKLEDSAANQAALDQLIELGYIAPPGSDIKATIDAIFDEEDYYRAVLYADEGKYSEAISILRRLYEAAPTDQYYGHRLAYCYLQTKQTALARDVVQTLIAQQKGLSVTLLRLQASVAMQEGEPEKAIEYLAQAIGEKPIHPGLQRLMGVAYMNVNDVQKAQRAFEAAIHNDARDHHAYHYIGKLLLKSGRPKNAAENILESINLRYFNPHAHLDLGKALLELKEYKQAALAFQIASHMMPKLAEAKTQLVDIYKNLIPQPEKAAKLQAQLPDYTLPEIIIVSGLPRSGTSLMMQMLDSGGIPIFIDKKRKADANNPKGYYEHEAVKSLAQNPEFLAKTADKAIKIIAHLLFHLPRDYRYKIIFMERDIGEVLQSQHQMLLRLDKAKKSLYSFKVWKNFHDVVDKVKSTFKGNPNVDILFVQHADAINKPAYVARRVQQFLDRPMDIVQMEGAVDKRLHREKSGEAG